VHIYSYLVFTRRLGLTVPWRHRQTTPTSHTTTETILRRRPAPASNLPLTRGSALPMTTPSLYRLSMLNNSCLSSPILMRACLERCASLMYVRLHSVLPKLTRHHKCGVPLLLDRIKQSTVSCRVRFISQSSSTWNSYTVRRPLHFLKSVQPLRMSTAAISIKSLVLRLKHMPWTTEKLGQSCLSYMPFYALLPCLVLLSRHGSLLCVYMKWWPRTDFGSHSG